jgi:hypothetical protein
LDTPLTPLPTMRMVVPKKGVTLKGVAPLIAEDFFGLGVVGVKFEIVGKGVNETVPAKSFQYGWGIRWKSTRVPNGNYIIRAVAYNNVGDQSTSGGVPVRVKN